VPAQQPEPWAGPAFQAPAAVMLESAKAIEKTKGYGTTRLVRHAERHPSMQADIDSWRSKRTESAHKRSSLT